MMFLTTKTLFLIFLINLIKTEDIDIDIDANNNKHIARYTRDNFYQEISDQNHFVMFYAPWCKFSKKMMPTWEKLANASAIEWPAVRFAKLNCPNERTICLDQDIDGYPTVKFYRHNGEIYLMRGVKSYKFLDDFLEDQLTSMGFRRQAEEKPEEVNGVLELTPKFYDKVLGNGKNLVLFYSSLDRDAEDLITAIEDVTEFHKRVMLFEFTASRINCPVHFDFCLEKEIIEFPTMLWVDRGRIIAKYKKSAWSVLDINPWIMKYLSYDPDTQETPYYAEDFGEKREPSPNIKLLTEENFHENIQKGIVVVKSCMRFSSGCKKLHPFLDLLADQYQDNPDVTIAEVVCKPYNQEICPFIYADDPTVTIYLNGNKVSPFEFKFDLDKSNWEKDISDIIAKLKENPQEEYWFFY